MAKSFAYVEIYDPNTKDSRVSFVIHRNLSLFRKEGAQLSVSDEKIFQGILCQEEMGARVISSRLPISIRARQLTLDDEGEFHPVMRMPYDFWVAQTRVYPVPKLYL